jgi:hypothetical protein
MTARSVARMDGVDLASLLAELNGAAVHLPTRYDDPFSRISYRYSAPEVHSTCEVTGSCFAPIEYEFYFSIRYAPGPRKPLAVRMA